MVLVLAIIGQENKILLAFRLGALVYQRGQLFACSQARVAVGLSVRELATMAKMSRVAVARFEGGQALKPSTIEAMQRALEKAGVEFIDENGGGAGVRLAKPKRKKSR